MAGCVNFALKSLTVTWNLITEAGNEVKHHGNVLRIERDRGEAKEIINCDTASEGQRSSLFTDSQSVAETPTPPNGISGQVGLRSGLRY